jgi:hypothetical protein
MEFISNSLLMLPPCDDRQWWKEFSQISRCARTFRVMMAASLAVRTQVQ